MTAADISTLTAALGGIQLGAAPTRRSATNTDRVELTEDLHWQIKETLLHYIEDYIFFLGDCPDKHDLLERSVSRFAARYRQQVFLEGQMNGGRLIEFEEECKREGCVYFIQVVPTAEGTERMEPKGNAEVHKTALFTLPPEKMHDQPLPMVELLANVVREILIAYRHDIWCSCPHPDGRGYSQLYRFPDLESVEPFTELMDKLIPTIEEWVDAVQDAHARIGHLLQ
ncbi:hypothetical protein BGZ96_007139 [Linnemannia gamsii]|uniref:Uncharacterized protein n=1 Tax=Linnemannia gamsii TaxID=64522 RepID=A0ABQ7K1Q6_9FUNG|nr:hypothetical protein BGZ96_007139 [Linnemannia gamsii]